ncbi:MAG: bifunctional oligoribonuclease/PAP phosphatase NrnA [Butyrivibrio sp.]|nr:bifunctional oligoribonuclease/PAP phosphatase NrnA [Acetatifactor muris]MCM1561302.1 bifunctional oligoribonuclease/PAP phosphatase NrnA [Butyrivibrio sp.]
MNLIQECKDAGRIGISGHVRPDGDCVGAVLSMQMYLRKCLPEAEIKVFLEKPADIFREIRGFDEIESDFPEEEPFDVFFSMDCDAERMGEALKYFRAAKKTINIDHHISNPGVGDVNYIKPEVGSTCELVYDLIEQDKLDRELAMAIYIGIIHDTGVFQYSNTTPATMEKGAKLISYGFDFPRLIQETFYQKTYVQSHIMGRALLESIRFLDNRCIVSALDRKIMDFYEVGPKDLDGIVNQLRNIKGISCAIFMYQTGVLEYKVSLRSDESVNVAEVASYFGGGGHARAAGCIMHGTFHDCVNNLSLHIDKQLRESGD